MATRAQPRAQPRADVPAAGARARGEARPDGFHVRAAAFHPVRAAYARQVLLDRLGLDPRGKRALVVGCGRGLLARELARLGFAVAALDPAPEALRLAEAATAGAGPPVGYARGDPSRLPYGDGTFDVAYYADTLETTADLDRVLAEAARALRRGGALLYDTVARTPLSRLIYLGALQAWPWTRIMPRHRYAWDRLRPPEALGAALAAHGLRQDEVRGFRPASPFRLLRALLLARRGGIDDAALAQLAGMHLAPAGERPEVTYVGFGTKQDVSAGE
jgi:2-polyprenyl-6-hydroxyphenyl methylase/3-demethylubiquinone-9 3-methyltransferase